MRNHHDEATRKKIHGYFAARNLDVEVKPIQNGYEILKHGKSELEYNVVIETVGQLMFGPGFDALVALLDGEKP